MQISKSVLQAHVTKISDAFFDYGIVGIRYPLEDHVWPISLVRRSPETVTVILGLDEVVIIFENKLSLITQLTDALLKLPMTDLRRVVEFDGYLQRSTLNEIIDNNGTVMYARHRCTVRKETGVRLFCPVNPKIGKWWQFWKFDLKPTMVIYPFPATLLRAVKWY